MKADKLNILYTCDNAYLALTGISMASVIANNPDTGISFYLATESPDSDEFRRLTDFYKDDPNIAIHYLDCRRYDELLASKGLDKWGSHSFYVYWKLFAYDLLDIDQIWYLDSDVICLAAIDYPEIDRPIGAVLDSAHADFNSYAHLSENDYFFNTGSLYVDVRKWKQERCLDKVIAYLNDMKYQPLMCDQDILAAALQEQITVLDPKYDYLAGYDYYGVHNSFEMYSLDRKPFYTEQQLIDAKDQIVFYHCLGGVFGRPWEQGNESPIKESFNQYRALSAWPDFESERKKSLLFKIEGFLEFLPKPLYNKIHNLAMRAYLKRLGKQND